MAVSLQDKQKENLLRMLEFNVEVTGDSANADRWGEQWKVLVYDHFCRDIISPILKLHELRKKGVTLHMLLETEREEIPDVPAIYFVQPTIENIQRIIHDSTRELYSTMHLNFASPISRDKLEFFAKSCVDTGCTSMISKVFDQHTNFVSLEPQLFSLNHLQSYVSCYDAQSSDATIERTMSEITQGLFSVLATMGSIPVIRCPNTEGPSRIVAEQLNQTLRDHLTKRSGVFNDSSAAFQRPVLIILDRNEDLTSMLHHPSTYQALVDDMLKIKLNRVGFKIPNEKGILVEKSLDLDVKSDKFFEANAGVLFPDAIASHEDELKSVLKKEKEISAKAGAGIGNSTKDLVAAVDTLPMLLEKKKSLEVHTNVFQATMDAVTQRQVPEFSMLEQRLIEGFSVPKAEILSLLAEKGSVDDKVRLLMIYYLTSGASSGEIAEFEQILRQDGGLTSFESAWKYIKQHTSLQKHASVGTSFTEATPTSTGNTASKLKGIANNWAGSFAGQAQGWLSQAAEQFKNFLPENKKLQLTRITDAICELKPNTEDDTYLYLDPKIKPSAGNAIPRQRTPFREAIVFVIGGGNYNEYQNLQAYSKAQPATQPRNVLYGCTELLAPNEFLQQLNELHT